MQTNLTNAVMYRLMNKHGQYLTGNLKHYTYTYSTREKAQEHADHHNKCNQWDVEEGRKRETDNWYVVAVCVENALKEAA